MVRVCRFGAVEGFATGDILRRLKSEDFDIRRHNTLTITPCTINLHKCLLYANKGVLLPAALRVHETAKTNKPVKLTDWSRRFWLNVHWRYFDP